MPGITHWQHPGFFAYFATTGSEPGILAELLAATLNVTQILWRTSPAATELELVTMDWLAQLLGLPREWHGHIEDTASTSTLAALAAARQAYPGRAVLCSEHAHSSVEKAARLLGLAVEKVPADAEFRMRTDGLRGLEGACALVATVGTTSSTSVDPVAKLAESMPRTPARRWSARSSAGPGRESSAPTRSSSTRTSGCSRRSIARRCGPGARTICTRR